MVVFVKSYFDRIVVESSISFQSAEYAHSTCNDILNSMVTKIICMSAISPFLFDQSFKGFDDPLAEFETTFQEVVKRLRQKFRYLHVLPSHEQN